MSDVPETEVKAWTPRPAQPYEEGNEAALRHGGFSARRIGERARIIVGEVLELAPHLAQDEYAFAVSEYAMARAQAELLTVAIEALIQSSTNVARLNARLIEAANSSRREAAAQRASLGLDPRSLAELRAISSAADLNVGLLARIAPEVPRAIGEALEALGMGERSDQFTAAFVEALRRIEGDGE
jgi:hypothetical protein